MMQNYIQSQTAKGSKMLNTDHYDVCSVSDTTRDTSLKRRFFFLPMFSVSGGAGGGGGDMGVSVTDKQMKPLR